MTSALARLLFVADMEISRLESLGCSFPDPDRDYEGADACRLAVETPMLDAYEHIVALEACDRTPEPETFLPDDDESAAFLWDTELSGALRERHNGRLMWAPGPRRSKGGRIRTAA
ncbi:hypothetical protein [Sinorhizobium meliloti]|uniref:hypothetical protein n=1 Tax=Rhizobium meliloti TaxID=382 RepID=UPI000FDC3EE1|nr:hypothetical protein [Sinorhizobium meliloti]RVK42990.1 hypothetical protein CN163_00075 [Sinorhizobium meliloti]